ncbi:unnamed protein product, partial [Staurois parvus]
MVEDTKHREKEKMELILTRSIQKLGSRGDTVLVDKALGRNKLLPQGFAVYPSPENKKMFESDKMTKTSVTAIEPQQSWSGEKTVNLLKHSRLEVRMREESGWTLTKEIVARQFLRNMDVVVPLEVLKIPEEPITTLGEYWCEVTVNGIDTVRVPVDVVMFDGPRSRRYRSWLSRQAAAGCPATKPPAEGRKHARIHSQ